MTNDIRVKRFWTEHEIVQKREPRPNPLEPGAKIGEPVLTPTDWVEYVNRVNDQGMPTSSIVDRVRSLDPANMRVDPTQGGGEKEMFFKSRWDQIEPFYTAWKEGNELPQNGTPLVLWAGLTAEQANVFKLAGIRSVEEIRDMSASDESRVRLPNVGDIKRMAGLYLKSSGAAAGAAREAAKDEQIAQMAERMAAMEELLRAATEIQDDGTIAQLRAELDAKGISYHHKAGVAKLRELLSGTEQAA